MNAFIMTVDGPETIEIPAKYEGRLGPVMTATGIPYSREMRIALAVAEEESGGSVYGQVVDGKVELSPAHTGTQYRNPRRIPAGGLAVNQG